MVWNPWKTFVKEFIFSKILGLLPVALLKKLLHRYFSRSLIIDFRKPIFAERLSVAASKIHKFPTSFMKSVLECIFYQKKLKNRGHVKILINRVIQSGNQPCHWASFAFHAKKVKETMKAMFSGIKLLKQKYLFY